MLCIVPNHSEGTGASNTYTNITSRYSTSDISYFREPYSSFKINRPLRGREQLDLSTNVGGGPLSNSTDWCEVFLHSYWPWTSPGKGSEEHTDLHVNTKTVGCVDFSTFRCVRIWLN